MTVNYKMWKIGIIAIPIFFIFFMLSIAGALYVAAASTIVVNGTCVKGDYYCDTIQEAVDIAKSCDKIIICPGTYVANIEVDKSVDICSYDGASNTVIQAYDMSKSVFHVTTKNANISGFTIECGGEGIHLDEVRHCNILNNYIRFNSRSGIFLYSSSNNSIKNNTAYSNEEAGICLYPASTNNIVENNNASNNKWGIYLNSSLNNIIKNNIASSNYLNGISLYVSHNNLIERNIASENYGGGGILIIYSSNNSIENNIANNNSLNGIYLVSGNNNSIKNNIANKSFNGIFLGSSFDNIIKNNIAKSNKFGVYLKLSCNNIIENNSAYSNEADGIGLYSSCNNNTVQKNFASNNEDGISLFESNDNNITNNIAKSNNEVGIVLHLSDNNTIKKNIALNNGYGIELGSSSGNIIKSNIANSNNKYGIILFSSNANIIKRNIVSNNHGGLGYGGISLSLSFNNIIVENIVNSNRREGISLYSTCDNILRDNTISSNNDGISLLNSSKNTMYFNNIITNTNQVADKNPQGNNWYHPKLLRGNYWSDYNGTDGGSRGRPAGDGIGDTNIPHPSDGYDGYPFVNKSGWLTFLISPDFCDFGTIYQGRPKNVTFEIQNRGLQDLAIVSISADLNIIITGIEPAMKIQKGSSKTFNVTIDATNLEGDVLRSVEITTDDKITSNKTILIYGFVKPPIHDVRIESIDFDSRVIKGQIDVFDVNISNHGSFDEHNLTVELKDGAEVIGSVSISELLAGENETVSYHRDTKDAASGVHEIAIETRLEDKNLLDSIKLKVNVLSASEASTLIVTNFDRLSELWGENVTTMLKDKLIKLSFNPCVNGIIIRVEEDKNCADAYELWKSDSLSPEKANKVARAIKQVIESKQKEYTNVEYIILVGDDRVIPFYRITDNSDKSYIGVLAWPTEDEYAKDLRTANTTISSALGENMMLTDDFYVDFNPEDAPVGWGGVLHIPDMPVGRLVESPEEICLTIETFIDRGDSVNPDKIFVTAYDFMNDSGCNCARALETLTSPLVMSKGNKRSRATYNSSSEISDELLTNRSDIIAIFQHADHSQFILYRVSGDDESISVTSTDISNASVDLNGAIVYTMGCHSGLNVPQDDKNDLVEAFISKKVLAYVAPTGYGIGSEISVAGHEKLLYYFTKYLCEGVDVGTALMYAKQDYYALEFDFDHIDGKVASTMIVYGLPMYRVNIEKSEKAEYLTTKSVSSLGVSDKKGKIEVATLTLRPSYSLVEAELGNYYYSEDYQSDSGKPIQPKVTWSYIVRDKKMLHGMVLKSASYKDEKNFNPVIDSFVVSPTAGYKRIGFDAKNWYPSNFFKINTVGDKQFLIIISGQYNPRKGVERLYNETTFDIYISAENEENPRPPEIIDVHCIRSENTTNITVNASDESGIYRVFIAYTDVKGEWEEWRSKELKRTGEGLWSCNILTGEEIEFFVQAVDVYGNVAVDDNRERYYPEKDGGPGPS